MGLFGKKLSSEEMYKKASLSYGVGRYENALPLMEKAARKGHVKALYYCGHMYDKGYGTAMDKVKALMWLEKAAGQGDKLSQFRCGEMYENGEGTAADKAKAKMWYEKAAQQGHDQARAALDRLNGQAKQAPAAPSPALAPKAEAPATKAEQLFKDGVAAYDAKDYGKALELFEQAAQQGLADAQFNCGRMYKNGEGTAVDKAKALIWFEKAAAQGYATAQFNCGLMYYSGEGTTADKAKALMWLEKVARQGNATAQFNCGLMYERGEGAAADKAKAQMWYEKAAQQGNAKAQTALNSLNAQTEQASPVPAPAPMAQAEPQPGDDLTPEERYTKGMELFKAGHYDGAFPLLKRACPFIGSRKDKYPDGQAAMGWMYENGQGTEAKDSTAYTHYKIAARNGNKDGMAGMVRLIVRKDVPSVDECQMALEYINQLGTEEAKSLLSTVKQKLTEAQKRDELKALDLTYENVNAIFDQCGKVNEDGSTTWDEEKLASNKTTIFYLMGQLALVREGITEHELDESFFKRYDGKEWAGSIATVIHLLNMGGHSHLCGFYKKDNKQFVQLRIAELKPTLSPSDPAFLTWWETAEALIIQAKIADDSRKSAEAMSLWEKAAELDNADAQYHLGGMYESGYTDLSKAIMWYQKAVNRGYEAAKAPLERCQIVVKAMQGDAKSQYQYAQRLEWSDAKEAFEFYKKSAEQGYMDAQYQLGLWYAFSKDIAKDSKKALMWFQSAAKQGHKKAAILQNLMSKSRTANLEVELSKLIDRYENTSDEEKDILIELYKNFSNDMKDKFNRAQAASLRRLASKL